MYVQKYCISVRIFLRNVCGFKKNHYFCARLLYHDLGLTGFDSG